jgi:hypothetical protein
MFVGKSTRKAKCSKERPSWLLLKIELGRIRDRMTFKGKMWSGTRRGAELQKGKGHEPDGMEQSTRNRDRE